MRRYLFYVLIIFFVSGISAKESLMLGVIPQEETKNLQSMYKPLMEKIEKKLGVKVFLIIPKSYDDLGKKSEREK